MKARYQRGCLRLVDRREGKTWLWRHRVTREDGKRVEHGIVVGLLKDLPTRKAAWDAVETKRLVLNINQQPARGAWLTFGQLAEHYIAHVLQEDQGEAAIPKAHSTCVTYKRYLRRWIMPRWGKQPAMEMQPLDVQRWLMSLGRNLQLSNPTRVKIRNLMSAVYAHGIRYRLLPLTENTNPMRYVQQSSTSDYEPVILTPEEAFEILLQLREPERTLVLTVAATGLRVSEALALVWDDIDFATHQISVRRAYVYGKFGPTKSRASRKPVPLHPLLAGFLLAWRNQTPYGKPGDFVFPSFRLKGKKPPVANMLVKSHLRPAALKAGISKPVGFHTFRHTLATVLVNMKHDPKLVQELLRQADVRTTLQLYAQAITPAKLAAQGQFLRRMLGKKAHRLVAGKARPTGSRRLHDQGLCRRRPGRPRAGRLRAR